MKMRILIYSIIHEERRIEISIRRMSGSAAVA